ncbi:MAG: 1-(5-phosphoribosyl)-5-[(5-phosphoribosylamino)methylideneamino]imidazole-4-carboxamide isomerase, partial [Gemmataceae bacterium]|nr:1-(5-phosphoribosyl)-5-[(5-phosphoribosylamino)methylideneamino]imidazole-4-carboxamide isomerase [Gemmataceae bacterium]
IDLRGGRCVRLRQGAYDQETVYGADPAAMAQRWVKEGAQALHLVDLDGAKEGRPRNQAAIRAIVAASGVPCQFGGGLRSEADILEAFAWGVARVVIGTKALQAPDWLEQMARRFPNKIALGIDAKEGRVATHGWLEVSEVSAVDLARRVQHLPLACLVYTDISRDGMLQGINGEGIAAMVAATTLPVIASGGVTTLNEVRQLAAMGVAGCIVGRALYEGRLNLKDILHAATAYQ